MLTLCISANISTFLELLWDAIPVTTPSQSTRILRNTSNVFTEQIKSKLAWCFVVVRQAHIQRSFKETAALKLWRKQK